MGIVEKLLQFDRALTVSELAKLLNMSRRTIYEHAASGRIPSLRIGSSVRFDPARIAGWVKEQQDVGT